MFKFGPKFIKRLHLPIFVLFGAALSQNTIGLALAQSESSNSKASAPEVKAEIVSLQFPPDLSVGRLILLKPKWKADKEKSSGNPLAEAKGAVKVAGDQAIMLIANDSICQKMNYLRRLPANALACLVLNGTSITSRDLAQIAQLSGLQRLELTDTDVDDSGLQYLARLSNLQYLQLGSTLIKGTTLDQLPIRHMKNLQLDNVNLLPKAFQAIAKFDQLRWLTLARSHVSDSGLVEIAQLSKLEVLIIPDNTDVSDLGLKKLASLKHLRRLNVANTAVTADGLVALKGLDLKWLKVSSRYKNDKVQLKLRQAFPLATIEFDNDHHRIPAEMFAPLH